MTIRRSPSVATASRYWALVPVSASPGGWIVDGGITNERGEVTGAQAIFAGGATAVAAAVYGGVPLEALEAEGALNVEGDRRLAKKFTTLFPLPSKAARPAAA